MEAYTNTAYLNGTYYLRIPAHIAHELGMKKKKKEGQKYKFKIFQEAPFEGPYYIIRLLED